MKQLWQSPILRVSMGIALLTVTLLLIADVFFGLSTEGSRSQLTARKHLAETLAVQYSELAGRDDYVAMRSAMVQLVERNPDVLSTALRRREGNVIAQAGDHELHWRGAAPLESTPTHARVPIYAGRERWGTLEVRFAALAQGTIGTMVVTPWFKLLCFVAMAGSLAYFIYMRRTLRHLDPSSVIPARVRAAFDVLSEGVAFVDTEERIVLVNEAFSSICHRSPETLVGVPLSTLGWSLDSHDPDHDGSMPWLTTLKTGALQAGKPIRFESDESVSRDFMVNVAPILDDKKRARGAIVTYDDVTELERNKQELEQAVGELRRSHDEIQRQNEKLEFLATRDPLTNCLNRRAFMEVLEREVGHAKRDGSPLACIMLDIDHFKSVNDTFGHLVGDAVIRFLAGMVSEVTRGFDLVCRYGGEEFCVLLPGATAETAFNVAERIREVVTVKSSSSLPELADKTLTVSLGVAELHPAVSNPIELVDQADGALYVSKTSGRNRTNIAKPVQMDTASVA